VFAIYAIALAYTFDRVPAAAAMSANTTLLLVFCGASMVGSSVSSALLGLGVVAYFGVFVAAGGVLAAVAGRAAARFEPVPDDEQHAVWLVPRTSPVVGELLPLSVTEDGRVVEE
jgi:hypothetical protein